uniref:Transmembrane protein n=1 Tax=Plectus sambesii TaxID=2011161 RepID=A0A914W7E5_9BILA
MRGVGRLFPLYLSPSTATNAKETTVIVIYLTRRSFNIRRRIFEKLHFSEIMTNQLLWPLLFLTALVASEELSKPGVNDLCADFCKQTHSKQANVDACEEGCRVFSMLQFVSGSGKVEDIRDKCQSGCVKSFVDKEAQDACQTGCGHQVPFAGGSMEISMNSDDPMFNVAKSAFDGVFDRMSQQMNDNFDRFGSAFGDRDPYQDMQRDMDAMSQRVENLLNRLMGRQPTDAGLPQIGDESDSNSNSGAIKPIQRIGGHESAVFKGPEVDNANDKNEPILHVEMTPLNANHFDWFENQPRPVVFIDRVQSEEEANWLACLAARARRLSAMTRWLICMALMMCVFCMIWLCMAIIRTAPRRRFLVYKSDEVMKIATIDSSAVEKQLLAHQHETKSPFM